MDRIDHFLMRPAPPRRMPTLRRLQAHLDIVGRHAFRARWGCWPDSTMTVTLGGRRRGVTHARFVMGPDAQWTTCRPAGSKAVVEWLEYAVPLDDIVLHAAVSTVPVTRGGEWTVTVDWGGLGKIDTHHVAGLDRLRLDDPVWCRGTASLVGSRRAALGRNDLHFWAVPS